MNFSLYPCFNFNTLGIWSLDLDLLMACSGANSFSDYGIVDYNNIFIMRLEVIFELHILPFILGHAF